MANPCLERLEQAFSNRSDTPLPSMSEIKFEDNPSFLPYGENYCEMGAMASIELSFEGTGKNKKDDFYPIDIFFNAQILADDGLFHGLFLLCFGAFFPPCCVYITVIRGI